MADEPINTPAPEVQPTQPVQPETASQENAQANNSNAEPQGQDNIQNQNVATETEPTNYSEAFEILNKRDEERAKEAIQNQKPGDTGSGEPVDSQGNDQGSNTDTSNQGEQNNAGGPSDNVPQFNRQAYLDQVEASVENKAEELARAYIGERSTKVNLGMLTQRDEENGITRFINPDNKEEMTRAQATEWVNTYNKSIDDAIKEKAESFKPRVRDSVKVAVQTNVYLNERWPQLSEDVQKKMDELTLPYVVFGVTRDSNGNLVEDRNKVVGFNCDLYEMEKQAELLVIKDKYDAIQNANNNQQQPQQAQPNQPVQPQVQPHQPAPTQQEPVETPALDTNTGNSVPVDKTVDDIKSYADAFEYINEQEALKKGNQNGN